LDLSNSNLHDSCNRATSGTTFPGRAYRKVFAPKIGNIPRVVRNSSLLRDLCLSKSHADKSRPLCRDSYGTAPLIAGVAKFPPLRTSFLPAALQLSYRFLVHHRTGLSSDFDSPSAVGRLIPSLGADKLGPFNVLLTSLLLSAGSMLVIWPAITSLGPLITFVIINGVANVPSLPRGLLLSGLHLNRRGCWRRWV